MSKSIDKLKQETKTENETEEEKGLAQFGFGGHFEKSLVQLPLSIGSNEECAQLMALYGIAMQLEEEEEEEEEEDKEEEEEYSTCEQRVVMSMVKIQKCS